MKWQDLVFHLLGISLMLVQYFLAVPPFLPLGMGMFILYHNILEVHSFYFIETQIQDCIESQKRLKVLTFKQWWDCGDVLSWSECILYYKIIRTLWRPEVERFNLKVVCLVDKQWNWDSVVVGFNVNLP